MAAAPTIDGMRGVAFLRRPRRARRSPDTLRVVLRLPRRAAEALAHWRLRRRMLALDAATLKDIAVPRCGVDWAVKHGRAERGPADDWIDDERRRT